MTTIRPIDRTDFAAWLPLWQGYQRFYAVEIPPEVTDLTFERFFDAGEPVHAAVAEADGLVGIVHWIYRRNTWTGPDVCYLHDLFVDPNHRGGRVGEALIAHVEAAARAHGCPQLYWLTQEANTTARRLYDRVATNTGFIRYRKML